jgi:6-phosphogluconate dehydrogenase-like protein
MAKIAFLGLGQMGAPMARRLLKARHEVTVWNRTAHHAEPLAAEGAAVAGSPAEAGAGAELAITMVATPEALQTLVWARTAWRRGLPRATCTSTCRPSVLTPSGRSPPGSRWASPLSTRRSEAALANPIPMPMACVSSSGCPLRRSRTRSKDRRRDP